jgi:hypothetical protein
MSRRITFPLIAAAGVITAVAKESHTVTVTVAGRTELVRTVPYGGGTVLMSKVSAGTHWVRLESPAATCLVASADLTSVTVTEGATSRVRLETECCSGAVPTSTVDRFDPFLAIWDPVTPMITARTGAAAVVVGGAIQVIGLSAGPFAGFSGANERLEIQ